MGALTRNPGSRRALFFTIDALIAALMMLAGLLLITSSYVAEQPKTLINTMSQDMIGILSELRTYEVNNSYIQALLDNGSIKDLNSTLLGQIGEMWSANNMTLAYGFAMNVSEGILPARFGYSIVLGNDTIYTRINPVRNSLVASKRVISGIQRSMPVKGYIAKARASTLRKMTNLVIPFSPAGAGWKGSAASPGIVQVQKTFTIPNASINNASAYLSLHLDRGSPNWNIVTINNGRCNITRDNMDLPPGSEGVFRVFRLNTSCFSVGNNTIRLDLRNLGYNAHIHPGTSFVISYNQTEQPVALGWEHSERIYFDNVNSTQGGGTSGAGPWVVTPFHIPTDATNISVAIKVVGRGVSNYVGSCTGSGRFYGWGAYRCKRDYDYIMFLNGATPFASNATPPANPTYFYTPAQTRPRIVNGTNLISVYFNNYEDDYWGTGTEIIYSNPLGNASGSSYVEVNYTAAPALPYGVIEVRQVKEFGGAANPVKDANFSFPSESDGVSSVFTNPVEQYSDIARVYSDNAYPPANLVFESPSSRAVPSSVYIPLWTLDSTPLMLNFVRIQELSGNMVLPNSTVDYGFYIRGFVGYGQVFSTQGEAVDDAIARLQQVLGPYVNATDLIIDNSTMSGVPSLWGPSVAEVRVWD
jgi:hypothetical protein